jgi:hypothetical protein
MPKQRWDELQKTVLMSCVVGQGAHLWGRDEVKVGWHNLTEMFYNQPEMLDDKPLHFTKFDPNGTEKDNKEAEKCKERIRNMYKNIIARVQADVDYGNSR